MRRDEPESVTPGGILLPDAAKDKPKQGKVLAVGPGKMNSDGKLVPLCLHEGDRITFSAYAGNEVEHEDEQLLIMSEQDVLARLEV